jgi:hypothetical protein
MEDGFDQCALGFGMKANPISRIEHTAKYRQVERWLIVSRRMQYCRLRDPGDPMHGHVEEVGVEGNYVSVTLAQGFDERVRHWSVSSHPSGSIVECSRTRGYSNPCV